MVAGVRLHIGSAPADASGCAEWDRTEATAVAGDLERPRAARLRPGHHRARLCGPGPSAAATFGAVRAELLAARFFPSWFATTAVCGAAMRIGCTVIQRLHAGPLLTIDAPVRVVDLVDEPERVAVTLVTVAGHPERGVERYELRADERGLVLSVTKAWTLPNPILRLGWPAADVVQRYATRLSLRHFRGLAGDPDLLGRR